jgi:hypothetical protein
MAELRLERCGTLSVTFMRRTYAVRPSTILLVVLALLASSVGVAVASLRAARALPAATSAPSASRVDRAHAFSTDSDDATRTAFVRPAPRSITRNQAPISGHNGDARGAVAPGAPQPSLEHGTLRAPATIEMRRDGVPSPGQPAPASRAPPVG